MALRQAQGNFDACDKYIEAEGHEQAKRGTHISGVPLSASNGSPARTPLGYARDKLTADYGSDSAFYSDPNFLSAARDGLCQLSL